MINVKMKNQCWKNIRKSKFGSAFKNEQGEIIYLNPGVEGYVTNINGKYKYFSKREEARRIIKAYMKRNKGCK